MPLHLDALNWLAVLTCIVVGQVFLTVWFAAIFARPWAKAYGVDDPKQHTKEVSGYTYGIGLLCNALVAIGLANLQAALGIDSMGGAVGLGIAVAIQFAIATALPGYAFQRRWSAGVLAIGSQTALIVLQSVILAAWN